MIPVNALPVSIGNQYMQKTDEQVKGLKRRITKFD
jgi:hypothetical protein